MQKEERLESKYLYKLELLTIKLLPMVLALMHLANTILSYFNIDLPILSYIGGTPFLLLLFLYLSSYVFKFCAYHRMFLHYIVVTDIITIYDTYVGIPVSDLKLLMIHLIVSGIALFLILYLYDKSHSKRITENFR